LQKRFASQRICEDKLFGEMLSVQGVDRRSNVGQIRRLRGGKKVSHEYFVPECAVARKKGYPSKKEVVR